MKKSRFLSALYAAIFLFFALCVDAAPVQWSGNGHRYEAIDNGSVITWDEASTQAQLAGGHLATITSSAENNFVFSLLGDPVYWDFTNGFSVWGPWLGGFQDNGVGQELSPSDDWQWGTGETWSYTNWHHSTPNQNGDEDYLHYYYWLSDPNATSTWNDLFATGEHPGTTSQLTAYVIEYETALLPIPATIWLLGSGLLVLIGIKKGKKTA